MCKWQQLSSNYTLKTPWFNLRSDKIKLPDQSESIYHVIEHPGFAVIVAITAENNVIMEKIYRYPLNKTMLECPSGQLDGDHPELAAKRELEEETGYISSDFRHLGHFYVSPGRGDEQFDLYLALQAEPHGTIKHENTEQIEVTLIPMDELYQMAMTGEVEDSSSALAILIARNYYVQQCNRSL